MKILLTGAAGFIGSCVAEALTARGDEVIGVDNFSDNYSPARKRSNVAPLLECGGFELVEMDFRGREAVDRLFSEKKPERVVHLGALGNVRYSVENPYVYVDTNVVGTLNLLEASRRTGVQHFVFASTSSVYGRRDDVPFKETDPTDRPLAPYPASKKAGEVLGHAYHNMHGLNFTALRFFNVYGPKGRPDMMPYKVVERMLKDEEIVLFDRGELSRDWTFVDDIVAGVLAALDRPMRYEIFNLGRGEPVVMTEFIGIAEELLGRRARIKQAPAPASEPRITFASVEKAGRLLGYRPRTSLREGMTRFLEWYRAAAG